MRLPPLHGGFTRAWGFHHLVMPCVEGLAMQHSAFSPARCRPTANARCTFKAAHHGAFCAGRLSVMMQQLPCFV